MKRAIKYFAAVLAAALLCLALVACGESAGKKYNFKETKATTDATSGASAFAAVETMYNTSYAGSTIEVKEGKIVWKIGNDKNTMTYTKDGDTYVLEGDFTKQLSQGLSSMGAGQSSVAFYGQETEEGFAILIVQTFTGNPALTNLTYTLYFTAA